MELRNKQAIIISDKIDFMTKIILRDKEGQLILIKGKTQQQDIMILNTGALNFLKEKLFNLNSQSDSNTTIVDDFNTLPPPINHVEKKLNRESEE